MHRRLTFVASPLRITAKKRCLVRRTLDHQNRGRSRVGNFYSRRRVRHGFVCPRCLIAARTSRSADTSVTPRHRGLSQWLKCSEMTNSSSVFSLLLFGRSRTYGWYFVVREPLFEVRKYAAWLPARLRRENKRAGEISVAAQGPPFVSYHKCWVAAQAARSCHTGGRR